MVWELLPGPRRPKALRVRRHRFAPRLEVLEDRTLLDAGVQEEYALELLNRMRSNPAAELPLLLNSDNSQVQFALSFFNVDQQLLAQQWATLTPAPALAWNDTLAGTALAHSQLMSQDDQQSHQLPGEPSLTKRIQNAGYAFAFVGENIYAYASDIFDAHAAFAIDWGGTPTGIQDPPGHRENIMDPAFRDVGIGLAGGLPGHQTGPVLITQDFGEPAGTSNPFVVGAVFADANGDGFYNPGEGLAGVNVSVTGAGGTFTTTTTAAGGYQLQLPAGSYTATFSGGGLAAPIVKSVSVVATNVWLDVNTSLSGTLQFSAATYSAGAADGAATITVTRTGGSSSTFAVRYTTGDGSAKAGTDYTSTGGTLTFSPGVTSLTFTVPLLNNPLANGAVTVNLTLSGPTGGAALASPSSAVLTITGSPITGVNPPPAPPPAALVEPLAARLVPVKVKKKVRLMVEVYFADTGELAARFLSPFQQPVWKGVHVTVRPGNGGGGAGQVVVTARRGSRTVSAVFPG